jgi:hypothetical protein
MHRIPTQNSQANDRFHQEHVSQALLPPNGQNDRGAPSGTRSCARVMVQDYPLTDPSPGANPTIYSDQRKSQLHHFTIGFQKPGICADSWFLECEDSWFLESNGKMVQLGFSLIKNRSKLGTSPFFSSCDLLSLKKLMWSNLIDYTT